MLTVDIENLGSISRANLSLSKNITVLAGPNNAGKTYGSYTLYTAIKWINEQFERIIPSIDSIHRSKKVGLSDVDLAEYISDIYFNDINNRILKLSKSDRIKDYILSEAFAVNPSIFINTKVSIKIDNQFLRSKISEIVDKTVKGSENIKRFQLEKMAKNIEEILYMVHREFYETNESRGLIESHFFPAERAAISLFSKELSLRRNILIDELLKESQKNRSRSMDIPLLLSRYSRRYPRAITDALLQAENPPVKGERSQFYIIATELENELLGNEISYDDDGQVTFKPVGGISKEMPFQVASSVVKSLASFILYLKHTAREGDVIFIDEPESNLHPDNQILIARYLVRLSKKGLKLIISTHSDYIVRELNNIIILTGKKASEQKKIRGTFGIHSDCSLSISDIEVYLFSDSTAKSIEITKEYGFQIESIDKAIEDQNSLTDNLL